MRMFTAAALAGVGLALCASTAIPTWAQTLPTYTPTLIADNQSHINITPKDFFVTQEVKLSFAEPRPGETKVRWLSISKAGCNKHIAHAYPELALAIERMNKDMTAKAMKSWDYLNEEESFGCVQNRLVLLRADDNYISFRREVEYYGGGPHGSVECTYYNIDPTGEFLSIDDFIEDSAREQMTQTLYAPVSHHANKDSIMESISHMLTRYDTIEKHFGVTSTGIEFHYLPYGLGTYAAGSPAVQIPYLGHKQLFSADFDSSTFALHPGAIPLKITEPNATQIDGKPLYPHELEALSGMWKLTQVQVNNTNVAAEELGCHSSITFQAAHGSPVGRIHYIRQQDRQNVSGERHAIDEINESLIASVRPDPIHHNSKEFIFVDKTYSHAYRGKLLEKDRLQITQKTKTGDTFVGIYKRI